MWRAWGIVLLLVRQDLGAPFTSTEHEVAIRPPAGWTRRVGTGPFIARFTPADVDPPGDGERRVPPWGITLSHLYYRANPTPLESFVKQAKAHIEREFKGSKITQENTLTIGGRAGYRIVFDYENTVQIKTVIPRTNLECYLADASLLKSDEEKYRKLIEASLASFQLAPVGLTGEETAADSRTVDLLKSAKLDPSGQGERWHTIHLLGRRTGWLRTSLVVKDGAYLFESEVRNDFGEGNVDATVVRGSFSPDARIQKVEVEQNKSNDKKESWKFRVTATIEGGLYKASRDMNGVKEEKSFKVEEGVVFEDVADFLRRNLVRAGKGAFLLKTISPYADEWNAEPIEVNERESLELDGIRREAHVLFCRPDRRRNMTYYVAPDGTLVRQGGVKDAFSIRLSTKEEAQSPAGK